MRKMTSFLDWALNTIRADDGLGSWLEEDRFEWAPDAVNAISKLLNGTVLLIVTDKERDWLRQYIMQNINHKRRDRPFLPVIDVKYFLNDLDSIKTSTDLDMAKDVLNVAFPNGHICWYIGSRDDNRARLLKTSDDSYSWYIDEDVQNKFNVSPIDPILDIKLLQFYRVFDKAINAMLFGEIDIG
jgi:hypothetical protein